MKTGISDQLVGAPVSSLNVDAPVFLQVVSSAPDGPDRLAGRLIIEAKVSRCPWIPVW